MMKKLKKTISLFVLAALLLVTAAPLGTMSKAAVDKHEQANAEPVSRNYVPEGYNEHEYLWLVEFLDSYDFNLTMKNGERLSPNFDPNDPDTWGWKDGAPRFRWEIHDGEKHLVHLDCSGGNGKLEGKLHITDFTRLRYVDCSDNFMNIGVENNPELVYLDFHSNRRVYSDFDLSESTKLEYLNLRNAYEHELDLTNCAELRYLSTTGLTELDISACTKLEYLCVEQSKLDSLDVSHLPLLKTLITEGMHSHLSELDLSGNPLLEIINCSDCNLSELDVSHLENLISLECKGNYIGELDVTANPLLEQLDCGGNVLTELDVSGNTRIRRLGCYYNEIAELDISNMTQLEVLHCNGNKIAELDFSNSPLLFALDCSMNRLREVNLENNPLIAFDHLYSSGNGYVGLKNTSVIMPTDPGECERSVMLFGQTTDASEFLGWYDEQGNLVYEQLWQLLDEGITVLTGVFSGGTPPQPTMLGDVDGNGSITIADSILTLRLSLGLADGEGIYPENADADGSGSVTVADAIIIARMALGIWERHE